LVPILTVSGPTANFLQVSHWYHEADTQLQALGTVATPDVLALGHRDFRSVRKQSAAIIRWAETVAEPRHEAVALASRGCLLPQTVADIETWAQELAERIQLTTQVATPAACDRTVQDCGCAVAALVEADHIHVTLSQTPYARTTANVAGRDISLSHRSAVRAHDWGKALARCLAMPDSTKRRLASVEALEFRQRLAVDLEESFARLSQLDQTLRPLSQFA
jgi:hypothetical protein